MRQKIVVGNWKMNLNYAEAMILVDAIVDEANGKSNCEIILAPSFIYLHDVLNRIQKAPSISLAAQNCSEHSQGAYTGEVSAAMLASLGVEYVIVGHSERRAYFQESSEMLARKVSQVLENSMVPIFCIGESLEQRKSGQHFGTIQNQLGKGIFHLTPEQFSHCIIAYEPVWAIGTGVNADAGQVQEMHSFIRNEIEKKYDAEKASAITILYGGSVSSKNAGELFSCADVDGGLVGGASLKAQEFISIVRSMK